MLDTIIMWITGLLALLVVLTTCLPFTGSVRWWIRGWDFPRLQIAVVAMAALLLAAWVGGMFGVIVAAIMVACLVYQGHRVLPFLPWSHEDLAFGDHSDDDIVAMSLNVEMENDRHDDVLSVIREVDPDVLLLMETDQEWLDAVEPVLSSYSTVIRCPQDDYWGLIFATRLKVKDCDLRRLTRDSTPSVFAEMEDHAGRPFRFIGLHPKPPVPGEDTVERDLQTLYAARFAKSSDLPVVVMGDFNDAVWSDTAQQFKYVGEYLDVRAGRGLHPSFHARHWWFRCPIDQLYVTEGVVVSDFTIGKYVGSDHFPVITRLRFDEDEAADLTRRHPRLPGHERQEFDSQIASFRADLEKYHAEGMDRDRLPANDPETTAPPREQ